MASLPAHTGGGGFRGQRSVPSISPSPSQLTLSSSANSSVCVFLADNQLSIICVIIHSIEYKSHTKYVAHSEENEGRHARRPSGRTVADVIDIIALCQSYNIYADVHGIVA